jgi:nicotinamidase-related amidase
MRNIALLVIDVQKGLDDPSYGRRNNPDAESKIARLLFEWRKRRLPVIHIRHCSVEPGSPLRPELPGNEFKEEVRPLPRENNSENPLTVPLSGRIWRNISGRKTYHPW